MRAMIHTSICTARARQRELKSSYLSSTRTQQEGDKQSQQNIEPLVRLNRCPLESKRFATVTSMLALYFLFLSNALSSFPLHGFMHLSQSQAPAREAEKDWEKT